MLGMAYKKDIDELREGENKWTSTVRAAQRHRRLRVKPAGGGWEVQMRDLLAINDEATLVSVLKSKYGLTPRDPRYTAIMQIWNDAQQLLRHER